ncbi:MAG: fibronectin type III domain-containing protein, partial [Planctomycetota bacterium]
TDHKQAGNTYYWRVQAVNKCGGGKVTEYNYATLTDNVTIDTRYYNISAPADTTAPTPDPMTWATVPYATGCGSISMTASTATDPSGVEYYFECTVGGGNDSNWQDGTTYADTSLSDLTQYTYRVKARDKSANQNTTGWSDPNSATTPDCTAPTPDPMTWATVPYATGPNSISMTASTATDPCDVQYYFDCIAGGGNDSGWQDSSTHVDTGLSPSTEYTYRVQAQDKSSNHNKTGWSEPNSDTTPPAAPTNLTTAAVSTSQIDLGWTDNSGSNEDGFRIERQVGAGSFQFLTNVGVDVNSHTDNNLTSDIVYTYRVCAYDTVDGNSTWSNEAEDSPIPIEPNGLDATAGNGLVSLVWNSSTEADWDHYKVYRATLRGGPYSVIDADHDANNYTDNDANNGTIYYYVVTTVDSPGNESAYSNEDSAFPKDSTAPGAPTGLQATGGDGFVDLKWTANTEQDLAGYNVYRSMTSGEPYSQAAGGVDSNSYTDNGLAKGRTYYYVVKAVDTSLNTSGSSNEASATPLDSNAPVAPANLMARAGDGIVELFWSNNPEPDVNGYNVYRSETSGFEPAPGNKIAAIVKATSFEDSGLANGVTKYYKTKAEDTSSNESASSEEVSATPETLDPPDAPSVLTATTVSSVQINLAWTDGSDNETRFRIERKVGSGAYQAIGAVLADVND